jgi:hypothetical protein
MLQNGSFNLSSSTKIYYDPACKNEADFLQKILDDEQHLNVSSGKNENVVTTTGNIYLNITAADSATLGKEGYTLQVDEKKYSRRCSYQCRSFLWSAEYKTAYSKEYNSFCENNRQTFFSVARFPAGRRPLFQRRKSSKRPDG